MEDFELVKDDSVIKERYRDAVKYLCDANNPRMYSHAVKKGLFLRSIQYDTNYLFVTYEILDELMLNLFTPEDIAERLYDYV